MLNFPSYIQKGTNDCGHTCLKIICSYYNINYDYPNIDKRLSIYEIITTLLSVNISAIALEINDISDIHKLNYPFITILNGAHYVVIYKSTNDYIYISDPLKGKIILHKNLFQKFFFKNIMNKGIVILTKKKI